MADNFFLTIFPVLLIGLIGLLIGGVVGALLASSQKASSQPDIEQLGKGMVPTMQVFQDPRSKKMAVEYDGSVYPSASKLSTAQKTALAGLLDDLGFWLGLSSLAVPAERLSHFGGDAAVSSTPGGTGPLSGSATDPALIKPDQFAEPGLANPEEASLLDRLTGVSPKTKEAVKEAPKTIAGQIDAILQEKLPYTELHNRSIRLMEFPERGMVVMVDGHSYEGVGDVPDPDVRQLIQSCVAEWENSG